MRILIKDSTELCLEYTFNFTYSDLVRKNLMPRNILHFETNGCEEESFLEEWD